MVCKQNIGMKIPSKTICHQQQNNTRNFKIPIVSQFIVYTNRFYIFSRALRERYQFSPADGLAKAKYCSTSIKAKKKVLWSLRPLNTSTRVIFQLGPETQGKDTSRKVHISFYDALILRSILYST